MEETAVAYYVVREYVQIEEAYICGGTSRVFVRWTALNVNFFFLVPRAFDIRSFRYMYSFDCSTLYPFLYCRYWDSVCELAGSA